MPKSDAKSRVKRSPDSADAFNLAGVLDMMRAALDKPVLVERDFQRETTGDSEK